MRWFKRYRAKVVATVEVSTLQWDFERGVRVYGNVKSGQPDVGKTYLLIEETT